jgi:hypothetical protein
MHAIVAYAPKRDSRRSIQFVTTTEIVVMMVSLAVLMGYSLRCQCVLYDLLRKHGKTPQSPFLSFSFLNNVKMAKDLMAELTSEDAGVIQKALTSADRSFVVVIVGFFAMCGLFMLT